MNFCRLWCRRVSVSPPAVRRRPTPAEMRLGVPEWFCVEENAQYTAYISREGFRFESVDALKRWRESYVCMDEQPYKFNFN